MMPRNRTRIFCKICGRTFEVRVSEVSAYATCSKPCREKYRAFIAKTRDFTWGDKISASLKGRPYPGLSDDGRERLRQAAVQRNFGKTTKGKRLSADHRKKISDHVKTMVRKRGYRLRTETIVKMRASRKRGEDSPFWRGGITKISAKIRTSSQYKQWRKDVLERDNYSCVLCGATGVPLHADHIKAFAYHPELRFDLSNGRALCVPCHKGTENYMARALRHRD